MSALPLAVRVVAGLAATAVERARRLPHDLVGLPVTAVSRAMQVSMRVQQQITELAIKGDNAIALLRTPSEEPPWAVFDEDEDNTVAAEMNHTTGVLGEYSELSLASLRGRLRMFGIDELQALLNYEQTHLNRPEFVRMLTNRIKTVNGR